MEFVRREVLARSLHFGWALEQGANFFMELRIIHDNIVHLVCLCNFLIQLCLKEW